jgi:hypothetical protein
MIAWLACAPPPEPDAEATGVVVVRDWASGVSSTGGTVSVQVEAAPDAHYDVAAPVVEGLTFTPVGEPRVERVAARAVETRQWTFKGEPGHYVVPAPVIAWSRGADAGSAAGTDLFVDLGVESLKLGELLDIEEPSEVGRTPWGLILAGSVAVAVVGFGLYVAFRTTAPVPVAAAPKPPDVVALEAWAAARRDPSLGAFEKALALSRIFREYAEAALHFPATKNTTPETLDALGQLPHLPEGNVTRAKRLLRATDRVKYAEVAPGADVFDELDADLRAFISDTRPSTWERP